MSAQFYQLLSAVFGGLGGEVQFYSENAQVTTREPDEIEQFIEESLASESYANEISVSVMTSTGDIAGRVFTFGTEERAFDFVDYAGIPQYAFTFRGEVRTLFYADGTPSFEPTSDETDTFPLPGFGGWELTEASAEKLVALDEAPAVEEESVEIEIEPTPEPEDTGPVENLPVLVNDAEIIGDMPQHVLDLPMVLGFGRSRDDKVWPAKALTFTDLLSIMTKHPVGNKDGTAFLQGSAAGNIRKKMSIDALYIMGLDVDCGIDIDYALAKVKECNLAAVVYTTNSHMGTDTFVLEGSYNQFCKKNKLSQDGVDRTSMVHFLVKERHWLPEIAETIVLPEDGATHPEEGKGYVLTHAPMPKFRIIFPLDEPFVIAKQTISQADALDLWRAKLLGLAKTLALPIDISCTDPSRLFYFPRHKNGAPFRTVVLSGHALDFQSIIEVATKRNDTPIDDNVFAEAAKHLAAGASSLVVEGDFNLKRWAAVRAKDFDIVRMFRDVAPGKIRNDQNTDKIEIECPFDHFHSNAGDTSDRACWVESANSDFSGRGFGFGCQHNTCKERDRLEFVAQACENGWFTRDDLSNEDFIVFGLAEEENEKFIDKEKIIGEILDSLRTLPKNDKANACRVIDGHLKQLVEINANKFEIAEVVREIELLSLMKTKNIKDIITKAKMDIRKNETADQLEERLLKEHDINLKGARPFILTPQNGYSQQCARVSEALDGLNRNSEKVKTRLFEFGKSKYSVEPQKLVNEVACSVATTEHLAVRLRGEGGVAFLRPNDEGLTSVPIPHNILAEMLAEQTWHCPELAGFSELPFYNSNYELVRETGYDETSKMYLKPSTIATQLDVEPNPTEEEVEAARAYLFDDVFGNFPFDDGPDHQEQNGAGSRAAFAALLLQPFVRDLIDGPTPIYLATKPTAGTGASKLLSSALFITSGKEAKASSHAFNDEEQRKAITSAFVGAKTYFWIDNIRHELSSAAYCNLATSVVWEDRMLGKSETVSFLNRMLFIIAGNNPRGTREMMRRCNPMRLDAHGDPNKRPDSSFKYFPLETYIKSHHLELVTAILTLVQAWVAAGHPLYVEKSLMSFESWSQVIGGILQVAKIPGFLTNLHLTQKYADDETSGFEALYALIAEKLHGLTTTFTVKALSEHLTDPANDFPAIGVTYTDSAPVLATRLLRVLNEKQGSPYDITANVGGQQRHLTVQLTRIKDDKSIMQYQLKEM